MHKTTAVVLSNNCPLFDRASYRTTAVGSPNKGRCSIKQLQGFTEELTQQLLFCNEHLPLLQSNNSTNNCSWLIDQLQLSKRTIAAVWTNNWRCVINICSRCTEQLQLLEESLQMFYRSSAEVALDNCGYFVEQNNAKPQLCNWTTRLQLCHRSIYRTITIFAEQPSLFYRAADRLTAVFAPNNCSFDGQNSTNNHNWWIERLQLLDWTVAVGWLNNCSYVGEQLQLFCPTSAVVASNKCSSCTKQLQFFYRTIQRKSVLVSSNNASNNCSWFVKQWQLFHRTTAGFHWTTDATTAVLQQTSAILS